jgi:Putative beta-barrel porin 2
LNPLLPSPGFGTVNPGATSPFYQGNTAAPSNGTAPSPGAASSFGGPGANGMQGQAAAPITYTIPGTYGQPPIRLTAGEGRLARPLYRFTASLGVGYDDNVLQTPTRTPSVPATVVKELIAPASPPHTSVVEVTQADGTTVQEVVELPAVPATTVSIPVPGVPAQKRIGSPVDRQNVGLDVQFADRTTVFTLDLGLGADYYWERPGTKTDYNGTFALAFLHRLTPLAQVTANVNANYITQPNLALVNTPTNNNVGPYLNLNARADLSYRLMPRFSTVMSVSYATTYYTVPTQQANTFAQTTYGLELRYLFSPLVTFVGEGRYSPIAYANDPTRAGDSYFLLGGLDLTLSRRLSATIRLGEDIRTFEESGTAVSSPYLELSSTYALTRATSLLWNVHYGLEEPPDANTKVQVLRTGLTLQQSLTPRLIGNLACNLVREVSTNDLSSVETVQNTAEATIGVSYTLSRHWTFSLNYTYDVLFSAGVTSDYYRNRIFLTANCAF